MREHHEQNGNGKSFSINNCLSVNGLNLPIKDKEWLNV